MPPKGRRGSDLTRPLTKTAPASISAASRSARGAIAGPERGAEAEGRVVGELHGLAFVLGPDYCGHGPKVSSSKAGMPRSTASSTVGG